MPNRIKAAFVTELLMLSLMYCMFHPISEVINKIARKALSMPVEMGKENPSKTAQKVAIFLLMLMNKFVAT